MRGFPRSPMLTPDEGPSLETSIFPLSFQVVREPLPFAVCIQTYIKYKSSYKMVNQNKRVLPFQINKKKVAVFNLFILKNSVIECGIMMN